ncbi:hypothetical protein AB3662_14160 [Sorangium cellulosum]|uniref:hypothetical protein n=1 Tax=Sorangium cellulosum TaxID=56 RepID=UPI003D9A3BE7
MRIRDLTTEFTHPSVEWHDVGRAAEDPAWFSRETRAAEWTLYVWTLHNDHELSLRDRNIRGNRPCGRELARPRQFMLKYGKCEAGIVHRHRQNHAHVHRCAGTKRCEKPGRVPNEPIRRDLEYFFAFDMTDLAPIWNRNKKHFREAEKEWTRRIQAYIEVTGCIDGSQDRRGESRHLVHIPAREAFRSFLEEVAAGMHARWNAGCRAARPADVRGSASPARRRHSRANLI